MFTGSGVAIVTPFNPDGSVNFDCYRRLIEFQIENGTNAILACGTTGEASTLTDEEQLEVIRFTAEVVNKRIPVIAGAGSNHTQHGIELCIGSQKAGADACLLVTPYYNKTTQRGLVQYYTDLASSIDIPVILYNVPSRTGLNITPQTVYELSKVKNIIGIKEASDNIVQIAEIAQLCQDDFVIYSGNDNQILPILALGGKGVISVLANIAPRQTADIVKKYLEGDTTGALKLQLDFLPLMLALFCEVNPVPIKAAMNLMGFDVGGYRKPLIEMEKSNLEKIRVEMKKLNLI